MAQEWKDLFLLGDPVQIGAGQEDIHRCTADEKKAPEFLLNEFSPPKNFSLAATKAIIRDTLPFCIKATEVIGNRQGKPDGISVRNQSFFIFPFLMLRVADAAVDKNIIAVEDLDPGSHCQDSS